MIPGVVTQALSKVKPESGRNQRWIWVKFFLGSNLDDPTNVAEVELLLSNIKNGLPNDANEEDLLQWFQEREGLANVKEEHQIKESNKPMPKDEKNAKKTVTFDTKQLYTPMPKKKFLKKKKPKHPRHQRMHHHQRHHFLWAQRCLNKSLHLSKMQHLMH